MTWLLQEKYKVPIHLPGEDKMTKDEFFEFCIANSDLRIERDEYNATYAVKNQLSCLSLKPVFACILNDIYCFTP